MLSWKRLNTAILCLRKKISKNYSERSRTIEPEAIERPFRTFWAYGNLPIPSREIYSMSCDSRLRLRLDVVRYISCVHFRKRFGIVPDS